MQPGHDVAPWTLLMHSSQSVKKKKSIYLSISFLHSLRGSVDVTHVLLETKCWLAYWGIPHLACDVLGHTESFSGNGLQWYYGFWNAAIDGNKAHIYCSYNLHYLKRKRLFKGFMGKEMHLTHLLHHEDTRKCKHNYSLLKRKFHRLALVTSECLLSSPVIYLSQW